MEKTNMFRDSLFVFFGLVRNKDEERTNKRVLWKMTFEEITGYTFSANYESGRFLCVVNNYGDRLNC